MSYGFSVWDSAGGLQIDSSRRYLRVQSVIAYTFTSTQYEIIVPVPGFTNDGTWFASCIYTDVNAANVNTYDHKIYVASTGQVGIKYVGRIQVVGSNLTYLASTGNLTIFRI